MSNPSNDMAGELIAKYLAGECDEKERELLLAWVRESESHLQHFRALAKAWSIADEPLDEQLRLLNVDDEWTKFVGTTKSGEAKVIPMQTRDNGRLWYRMAAAVAVVFVSAFVLWYTVFRQSEVIFRSGATSKTLELPDGSKVVLNQFSSLAYDPEFGTANRNMTLHGEAFFDVTRNEKLKFSIATTNATVEVIGTSFNVRGYDSLAETEVTVRTGIVRVKAKAVNNEVVLKAGDQVKYEESSDSFNIQKVDVEHYVAWQTRKVVFENASLAEVADVLSKMYGVAIVVSGTASDRCLLTATFDHQSIESVLKVLQSTLGVSVTVNGSVITISSAGC